MAKIKKGDVNKVVLAYSGGLDTSIILKWLQTEYGAEVVTFTADLGQSDIGGGAELEEAKRKAEKPGHQGKSILKMCAKNSSQILFFPMFRANAVYEGRPICSAPSIARPLISKRLVEIARENRC